MQKKILLIFFFCLWFVKANAQKTIELYDTINEFVFEGEYFEILEDKKGEWSIEQIASDSFSNKFILNKSPYVYNENTGSVYWIKFKVRNHAKSGKNFLLESYAPHTNDWRLYIPDGKRFILKQSGLDLYFYDREYVNKNLIFDLPLDSTQVNTFYIRVFSKNFSSFDFRIKPQRYFFFYSVNEYYFLGVYYGILLIMAVYNLLMFISIRERVYIYYVLYVFAGMLTTLTDDGIGYQYIWVGLPHFSSIVGPHVAPPLLLITFMLYSREFLKLSEIAPKYDKILIGLTGFYILYHILKLTVLPLYLHSHIFYVIPFVALYAVAIKSLFDGYKPARYFVIAYSFILVSIIIIKLRSNGSIDGNLFTVYSLNYGLVLEVIVLSLALADRIRITMKEKERALRERNVAQYRVIRQLRINEELKDKVNKELEAKVTERTKELNEKNKELAETNIKLKEMTDRANEMSLKLDMDNWNLQKKVKESIQARMTGEEVSYEEFNKIFPDESACFRYLHDLKWAESYVCRRCGNKESVEDESGFAKRCTKCSYVESVTANTLFHGLRFPINKAFYITYLTINQKDRMTLDDLSALIDLRRNTCWKFRKKIQAAIEMYSSKRSAKNIKSWEDVIFFVPPTSTSSKTSKKEEDDEEEED